MRVPQYKSQTQRTNKTGGGTLSVQANPGALSAGLDAFAGFARNVQQQGLNFYEQELKTQRASALASAETELDIKRYKYFEDNAEKYPYVNVVQIPSQEKGMRGSTVRKEIEKDMEQGLEYFVPEEVSIEDKESIEEILTSN